MSTKEWIYQSEDELCKFGIYQELTLEDDNNNPATISVKNPSDFSLDYYTNAKHKSQPKALFICFLRLMTHFSAYSLSLNNSPFFLVLG